MRPFAPGLAAADVDQALRDALHVRDQAEQCALLWFAEVARRGLYRDLGHASLELYATQALGFSRDRTFRFKRLADDLERLPRLRAAVADGTLGWTKAQQVGSVATPATEKAWVAKAARLGRRELTAEVKRARARRAPRPAAQLAMVPAPGAQPVEDPPTCVTFRLDGVQLARYEALIERVRKKKRVPHDAPREEILLAALAALADGDARGAGTTAGVQIVIRQCPTCERMAAVTNQGEKRLARADSGAAACDARIRDPAGRNRATIAPRTRAAVLARDHHRCTTPGCGAAHFLEVHHVVPRHRGGTNEPENLITLCSRCHRYRHQRE